MGESLDFLKNKRNLVGLIILGILILAIPLGLNLLHQQQILKSKATEDPIKFTTGGNVEQKDGKWVVQNVNNPVVLQLNSPLDSNNPPPPSPPPPSASSCSVTWGGIPSNPTINTNYTVTIKRGTITNADWGYVSTYLDEVQQPGALGTTSGVDYQATIKATTPGAHILKFRTHDYTGYKTTGPNPDIDCTPTQSITFVAPILVSTPTPTPQPTTTPTFSCSSGLLTNGCFETANHLDNWGSCGGAFTGTCTADSSVFHSGGTSFFMTNTGGPSGNWGWQTGQAVNIAPGDTFCVSGWVKKQHASDIVIIGFQSTTKSQLQILPHVPDSTEWQQVKYNTQTYLPITSDWGTQASVLLRVQNSRGGAWFDDISVTNGSCG